MGRVTDEDEIQRSKIWRKLRTSLEWSRKETADETGVSESTIKELENGTNTKPGYKVLTQGCSNITNLPTEKFGSFLGWK